ncbi:type III-B CRISPR module RAMP protein Cmr4 [Gelria sp. Kuro-4]|uniref:type III-B CRISPR module RAMP protein Cmr4 n=1 Tax=Gelria sp. Kuro-4 TaxID=2796927 RepID=UPI001BF08C55|nr:type III-B CRISPR module RAMP protein Cmr4 [Gelria sp. Kuro-4]BCV26027.1 hypothetical protein kuro4_28000 [Gelria sp. Kuro-4]
MGLPYEVYRYFLVTLDPLHVGTGGYRLGRVDLSIMREPGTRLPKIPGTTLHGTLRHYAAYRYGRPQCAKQGEHCGQVTCPICYTFGNAKSEGGGFAGVVSVGDARILLFPVYSRLGPLWVTTLSLLQETGFQFKLEGEQNAEAWTTAAQPAGQAAPSNRFLLNLGWLALEVAPGAKISATNGNAMPFQAVQDRLVIIPERLFSQVVNSNLEVRTSVSIDPETGAATDRALFTYEAIPRATYLWFEAVVDDYRGGFPHYARLQEWKKVLAGKNEQEITKLLTERGGYSLPEDQGAPGDALQKAREEFASTVRTAIQQYESSYLNSCRWHPGNDNTHASSRSSPVHETPADVVRAGLEWAEHLGIGGMGTRGFGRVKLAAEPQKLMDNSKEGLSNERGNCAS